MAHGDYIDRFLDLLSEVKKAVDAKRYEDTEVAIRTVAAFVDKGLENRSIETSTHMKFMGWLADYSLRVVLRK